jgi:hypothetical protein
MKTGRGKTVSFHIKQSPIALGLDHIPKAERMAWEGISTLASLGEYGFESSLVQAKRNKDENA